MGDLRVTKAHAYGNDFLYVEKPVGRDVPLVSLARAMCDRHRGVGADGLIFYTLTVDGAQVFTAAGTATTATFAWNTTTVADGAHTLGLTVRDGAGCKLSHFFRRENRRAGIDKGRHFALGPRSQAVSVARSRQGR